MWSTKRPTFRWSCWTAASLKAKVIGTDKDTDVAVLKITAQDLPTAQLGDSAKSRVGDLVFAIGNPFSVGQTVTMGIVSAKSRAYGAD